MLKKIALLSLLFSTLFFSSCNNDDDDDLEGNWSKVTPFKGSRRSGCINFTIGDVTYAGLGYNNDGDYESDFYSYDIDNGYWEPETDFPGTLRERAVSFAIDGIGYIGLGYNRDEDTEEIGDWWSYNPSTQEWTQLNDFDGGARYNTISFVIDGVGYVGTGYDGTNWLSDLWSYDATGDTWTQINSYPGEKIESGMAFVIDNEAYVCGGRNNGVYNNDMWKFTPSTSSWTDVALDDDDKYYEKFRAAVRRHDAVALYLDSRVFFIGGAVSSSTTTSVYQWDLSTDKWKEKTSYEGSSRSLAIGYILNSQIFVGTGVNSSVRYDDIWEFKPDEDYDEDY